MLFSGGGKCHFSLHGWLFTGKIAFILEFPYTLPIGFIIWAVPFGPLG
jgi:hypothetical protein